MTTEVNSAQVEKGAFSGMNPYTTAIASVWIGAFFVAGILVLMGFSALDNFDTAEAAVRFTWAAVFGSVGIGTLMTWLVVNALLWKPPSSGADGSA